MHAPLVHLETSKERSYNDLVHAIIENEEAIQLLTEEHLTAVYAIAEKVPERLDVSSVLDTMIQLWYERDKKRSSSGGSVGDVQYRATSFGCFSALHLLLQVVLYSPRCVEMNYQLVELDRDMCNEIAQFVEHTASVQRISFVQAKLQSKDFPLILRAVEGSSVVAVVTVSQAIFSQYSMQCSKLAKKYSAPPPKIALEPSPCSAKKSEPVESPSSPLSFEGSTAALSDVEWARRIFSENRVGFDVLTNQQVRKTFSRFIDKLKELGRNGVASDLIRAVGILKADAESLIKGDAKNKFRKRVRGAFEAASDDEGSTMTFDRAQQVLREFGRMDVKTVLNDPIGVENLIRRYRTHLETAKADRLAEAAAVIRRQCDSGFKAFQSETSAQGEEGPQSTFSGASQVQRATMLLKAHKIDAQSVLNNSEKVHQYIMGLKGKVSTSTEAASLQWAVEVIVTDMATSGGQQQVEDVLGSESAATWAEKTLCEILTVDNPRNLVHSRDSDIQEMLEDLPAGDAERCQCAWEVLKVMARDSSHTLSEELLSRVRNFN